MRPIASTMTEIDNLEGDEVEFTVSKANQSWVIRSMADLYSNRELAVVREYSTNALDSNVEKAMRDGHDPEPIHVTLPNALNPYFVVEDRGIGMSETELREVYTEFGESTKRYVDDANRFNGMLGFGCKSAVGYTNTFTVTAVQSGYKTVAVITRREDAMGGYRLTLKIVLSKVETAEPDGVTIQVPVHNWQEFEKKARDFYRFWKPGTVLVNGKEPEMAVGEKIDDNLYYYDTTGWSDRRSFVVMGNVPYQIANPDALFPPGMNKISFVGYLDECNCDFYEGPHPQVEFVPSREALKYSDHTKHHLHKIISDFVAKSVELAKAEIAGASSHFEAYKLWKKWRSIIGTGQVDNLTYKGDALVERFEIHGARWNTRGGRYSTEWHMQTCSVEVAEKTLFVTGFPSVPNLNASQKRKANAWRNMKQMSVNYIFFTEETNIKSPWIDPANVVEWEKVKAEAPKPVRKPSTTSTAPGRLAGSFDLISSIGREYEQSVPTTKPLYYISVKELNHRGAGNVRNLLNSFDIKEKVVILPANRKDKFLRCYPHAENIMETLKAQVVLDWEKLISADGQTYYNIMGQDRDVLRHFKPGDVDDPELQKFIAICAKADTYLDEYKKHRNLAYMVGLSGSFVDHPFDSWRYTTKYNPLKKYPLAYAWNGYERDEQSKQQNKHIKFYINAAYAARKDGKNV